MEIKKYSDRTECRQNGLLHREDGPAVEYANGDKYWYKNDKCHREDGPAIERTSGSKFWYKNGLFHREDGPACEYANGDKLYARIIGNYHVVFNDHFLKIRSLDSQNYNYFLLNIKLPFDISESKFKKIITFL